MRYETHAHTSETSRCSHISGGELAEFYKSLGYTGLFITDHFFNGNTTVPRGLDWHERVDLFCAGYDAAKAVGDKIGLDVFFGWEYSINGNDFLIYGLDRDWLHAHPDQLDWKLRDYMSCVRADGGFVVHAHPFREAGYIELIRLIPRDVDAVEIINSSMPPEVNERAEWYADSYGLLKTAGSDNHVGRRELLAGVDLPKRISSAREYGELLFDGRAEIFCERMSYDEK